MIKFNKIENGDIFTRDFRPFVKNNEIDFPTSESIAVIYGPNGTGKTSLIKVFADEKATKVEYEYEGQKYSSGKNIFHIINDQNNRNIIRGETKDFLLGDNIKREFELQELISKERTDIINSIISLLKSYGISSASSSLIELFADTDFYDLLKDIANNKSKGNKHSTEDLISKINKVKVFEIPDYDKSKFEFIQNDISNKDSIVRKIEELIEKPITPNPNIHQVEENTEAIKILNRFHKDQCIVCDTSNIDWNSLLNKKTNNRKIIIEKLDDNLKSLIENVINSFPVETTDPFKIKICLIDALSLGDNAKILSLLEEFEEYKTLYIYTVLNNLLEIISKSDLPTKLIEQQKLMDEKPEITDEDMIYVEEIINNSMNKKLTLERDTSKNLRIHLSNKEFLGKTREELPLSTGEQNFLSLTFEFLKAKNSVCPVVVIDDPISSFDSIYKNKVIYAIIKMLHHKKRIVLTHNIDLLRLLDSQFKNCYKLYLLNNTDGEENGFIAINNNEREMLISLEKLLLTFRENISSHIKNPKLFLISMIPFMRGYANITNNSTIYENLTYLMHGYRTDKVDIADAYKKLFGNKIIDLPNSYEVSVPDILLQHVDGIPIIDPDFYPLLNKTLQHSFTYLFLRLLVENKLVTKFNIDTTKNKQLGQIISAAYPKEQDITEIRNRIRLTSKKTLINEFNHFEGNLSIFQPAIDITDQTLGKEKTDITTFVKNL